MKKLIFIFILLSFISSDLLAQHTLGDLEASSFQEMFNPTNRNLWEGKNKRGLNNFKTSNSDVWTKETYSHLRHRNDEKNTVILVTEEKHTEDFWNKQVIEPLNEQFGNHSEVMQEHPFLVLGSAELEMVEWVHEEGNKLYRIRFGEIDNMTGLIIHEEEQ